MLKVAVYGKGGIGKSSDVQPGGGFCSHGEESDPDRL